VQSGVINRLTSFGVVCILDLLLNHAGHSVCLLTGHGGPRPASSPGEELGATVPKAGTTHYLSIAVGAEKTTLPHSSVLSSRLFPERTGTTPAPTSMTMWGRRAVRGQFWAMGHSQGHREPLRLPGSVHVKWQTTTVAREIWSSLLFTDSG